MTLDEMITGAVGELQEALNGVEPAEIEQLVDAVVNANRVVCSGMGREGLALRAFCMRLMHLGMDAHFAGDITAKPVGPGGLVIIAAGPGDLPMAETMASIAHNTGAQVAVLTAQPGGAVPAIADLVVTIPAQTLANDAGGASILPMGTTFEIAMLILLDLVVIQLRQRTGQSMAEMRARHFNLE